MSRILSSGLSILLSVWLLLLGSGALVRAQAPATAYANVQGIVWIDTEGDGKRDGNEPLASAALVSLRPDQGISAFYTNDQGAFSFSVPEGFYTVEVLADAPGDSLRAPNARADAYLLQNVFLSASGIIGLSLGARPTAKYPAIIDAKIEVVWPHDGKGNYQPAAEAPLANISASLFFGGTTESAPCSYKPTVELVMAVNDRPGETIARGQKRIVTINGRTFPTWEFNDIDVSAAWDATNRLFFWLKVTDTLPADTFTFAEPRIRSNVWTHAIDARTYSPQRLVPEAVSQEQGNLAAVIDVVWPHNGTGSETTVEKAKYANIDVLLLKAESLDESAMAGATSVRSDFDAQIWLEKSLDNGAMEVLRGRKMIVSRDGLVYPKWVFEDIDVSAANQPGHNYYFRVAVAGNDISTNVWAHGQTGLTNAPARNIPPSAVLGCN